MKTPKGYRLSPSTLTQIDWLSRRLNLTATDIVQMAISQIYQIEQAKLLDYEIIKQEDGYALQMHGETVLLMGEDIYDSLPEEVRSDIELGNTDSGMALAHLLLIAASKGEKVVVFEDAIQRVFISHH